MSAYEAGCNNVLLAAHSSKSRDVLEKIQDCSRQLSAAGIQPLLWQARGAWAMDHLADGLQAEAHWRRIAGKSLKATPETERAYVAMAKLKLLDQQLKSFKSMRFSQTNEKPEVNIGKKTKALEEVERLAELVIQIGTPKQIISARNVIRLAYLDFAEAMEEAALPSKLTDAEKTELKKSFLTFAKDFRDRAETLNGAAGTNDRAPASLAEAPKPELKLGSLTREESNLIREGRVPAERAAEIYAKKALASLEDGRPGEARYFGEKWKKELGTGGEQFGSAQFDQFQALLVEKLPDLDPVSREF
jgi:hypothetical protein